MKHIYLTMTLAALMVACSGKKEDSPKEDVKISVEAPDIHNANNSLDYVGTYVGPLPSASGSGMSIVLTLTQDSYEISITYNEKPDQSFDSEGKYSWNNEGNTITLENEEVPNQYFVAENRLFKLDADGKRITGDLADMYILYKQ